MLQSLISSILIYISTSIDYLILLVIIFTQAKDKNQKRQVYIGQYLGTGILVLVSLLIAYFLNFVPQDWIIGLLGLIPIYLGIRAAVGGEEEAEEDEIIDRLGSSKNKLFWEVALITIASGGDNLGIYIPYFVSIPVRSIILTIIVFIVCIYLLNLLCQKLSEISFVHETIERYERIIVPVVFIGLGIFIMYENNTFQAIINFLQ